MGVYLLLYLVLLCAMMINIQGYLLNTSPCGKDLADIAVFPEDPLYENSTVIWNSAYADVKPAFVALPKTVADIQRCLVCAYEHTVPFTVKSGGHNSIGLSTINGSDEGGFVIYLSQMKAVDLISETEIKVQAGARWEDIYGAVKKTNYIIVGGDCPTVGVAGFTLGGGMSIVSRKYGLAIDNVLSFTMATIDGTKVVTANATTNTELYWALRGGGGGNFGVVIDFTFKLQPSSGSYTYGYMLFVNDTSKNVPEVLSMIGAEDFAPELTFEFFLRAGNALNVTFLNSGQVSSSTDSKLNNLSKYSSEHETGIYSTYWDVRDARGEAHPRLDATSPFLLKGCFVKTITPAFAKTLSESATPKQCYHSFNHHGGAVAQYKPNDTAFPHRSPNFDLFTTCSYTNDLEMKINSKYLHDLYSSFNRMGICEGNYVNDPELDLHDWQHKFYGSNYERLLEIQEKWNPLHVGTYHYILSIGSDYNPPPAHSLAYGYGRVEL